MPVMGAPKLDSPNLGWLMRGGKTKRRAPRGSEICAVTPVGVLLGQASLARMVPLQKAEQEI